MSLLLCVPLPVRLLSYTAVFVDSPVLQEQEGRRDQREIQEWPFAGVSLFRVLGRSCGACGRVCAVQARFQAGWRAQWRMKIERKSCCAHAHENFLRLRRW